MEKLKIAIQKSGRLFDKSIELLKDSGIRLQNGSGKLLSVAEDFPLDILFLRVMIFRSIFQMAWQMQVLWVRMW